MTNCCCRWSSISDPLLAPCAGRAVVDALVASNKGYRILAITRSASSGAAQSLAKLPNTKVVEGTFDDPAKIFKDAGEKIDSAFLVTVAAMSGPNVEEPQGKVRAILLASNSALADIFAHTSTRPSSTPPLPTMSSTSSSLL